VVKLLIKIETMKTVHELNTNELEELRDRFFDQLEEQGEDEVLGEYTEASQIPMSNVKVHYEGTHFVDEDFWCNEQQETKKLKNKTT
jgi:hypothetical protein